MNYTITVLPGDGIGPEVITEAVKVLNAVGDKFGHIFTPQSGPVGGNAIDNFGTPLPEETKKLCENTDGILFGAVGGPKWDDPQATTRPEDGILAIRKNLGLFANLRPVKIYPQLINSSPVKPEILQNVDMLIIRELTGGLYFAEPKKRWEEDSERKAVDTLLYSEHEIERVVKVAFELAKSRKQHVTSVDKANVLESSRLWREVTIEVSKQYPEIELDHLLVDNASMQIIREPSRFDVIVAENTFGDILTDEASILSGSMGMLPSASLAGTPGSSKTNVNLFEPIHGSAPDIAGQGIANPLGTILSMALMLRYSLNLHEEANAVERAVEGVLSEGFRTTDIASDGGEIIATERMGDLIAGNV
ncbi:MAG: 3-isopropylmalate dehydrogenase [SAR202 cluster bacterium]|nr:3-isopropylmalate dehydrogenase [SAR202 cluster bacterium]